jgi:hypothetical protein
MEADSHDAVPPASQPILSSALPDLALTAALP